MLDAGMMFRPCWYVFVIGFVDWVRLGEAGMAEQPCEPGEFFIFSD